MRLSPRIQALGSSLPGWTEILLVAVLCWQCAGMFWTLFAPSTQNVSLLMPQQASDKKLVVRDAFLSWFAGEGKGTNEAPETYRLLGIIAGEHGSAVLKLADGRSVAVRLGDEIAPGVTLVALEANQITIERSGSRQVISLPQQGASQVANGDPASVRTQFAPNSSQALGAPFPPNKMGRGLGVSPVQAVNPVTGERIAGASSSSGQGLSVDSSVGVSESSASQSSQSSHSSSTGQSASTTTQSSVAVPTSTTGTVSITLTRGPLQNLMPASVAEWSKGLSLASAGGIRVGEVASQPLYRMLQLEQGDILKSVNENPLTQLADLAYVDQAFRKTSAVKLVVLRNGQTYTLRYTINNVLLPITLSRGQLLTIIQGGNIGDWNNGLSTAPGGGIQVDDATIQPMAKSLQLKSGDVLKSINNQPLTQLSDLSLFFQAFGQLSSVDLVLIRDGFTLTQHYDIQT